jgi:hypothetical protein
VIPLPPDVEPPQPGDGLSPSHPIVLPPQGGGGGEKYLVHVQVVGYGGVWFLIEEPQQPTPPPEGQPKPSA